MQKDERAFSAEGAVVEILERGGERFAKILIAPSTVLELPSAADDLSLGDRVIVDAALDVTHVRRGPDRTHGPAPGPSFADGGGDRPAAVRPTWRDYQHVFRMAGLFAFGLATFLVWRSWMVPPDFGELGHFRTGAIVEASLRTPRFAGQASCVTCHDEPQQVRATGRHAAVSCEACHGPLGDHARGEADAAPIRPSTRATCLSCHTSRVGMPAAFPRIAPRDHSEAGPCTDCHPAHAPGISRRGSPETSEQVGVLASPVPCGVLPARTFDRARVRPEPAEGRTGIRPDRERRESLVAISCGHAA